MVRKSGVKPTSYEVSKWITMNGKEMKDSIRSRHETQIRSNDLCPGSGLDKPNYKYMVTCGKDICERRKVDENGFGTGYEFSS